MLSVSETYREALVPCVSGLGLTAAAGRTVTPVPDWALKLVPAPVGKNETVKSGNESVETDTIPLIKDKIVRTLSHTKKLAPKLKGATLEQTLRNDWDFIFDHIKYKPDAKGREQVRSPRRLIHEGKGDCDCFTVTLGSFLMNQGIPFKLRIIKQNGSKHWSHIYVVVPKSTGGHYTLDPVTDRFNYEAPHTTKKDFSMALEYLDGLRGTTDEQGFCRNRLTPTKLKFFVPTATVEGFDKVPTKDFLDANKIPYAVVVNDDNQEKLLIDTPTGKATIPTIITEAQATIVKENNKAVQIQSAQAEATPAPKVSQAGIGSGWGWLAALLIGGALFMKGDAAKKTVAPSLNGVKPKKTVKRKKYKTIHI